MEYNTDRVDVKLKEYGRNIQNMVDHIKTVQDKDKRNSHAETLVRLMKQINPNFRDTNDYDQKVWDDLFIISQFELDVESSPYPKPNAEILDRRPERVPYKSNEIKFKHYGRNVEMMVEHAVTIKDPEEREAAIVSIGRLMKAFFNTWNKDNIDDKVILQHLKSMSDGQLEIDPDKVRQHRLFDSAKREKDRPFHKSGSNFHRRGQKRKKRRN